jgi:hypothetical protein
MKRKELILSLLFIYFLSLLLISLYFIYFSSLGKRTRYETNISELYSRFTPTLKNAVSFRLKAIECNPSKYYLENEAVCFVCRKATACFHYALVNWGPEGMKMEFTGMAELKGKFNEMEALAFYSFGISKLLDCQSNLVCQQNIKATIEKPLVKFQFPSTEIINGVILELKNKLGIGEECKTFGTKIIECGQLEILWISDDAVAFVLI